MRPKVVDLKREKLDSDVSVCGKGEKGKKGEKGRKVVADFSPVERRRRRKDVEVEQSVCRQHGSREDQLDYPQDSLPVHFTVVCG